MNLYCNNCGNEGHLYRQCRLPVLSYGILILNSENHLLMIRRKDSLSYIEFLRGKYDISNSRYIQSLLRSCSFEEQQRLLTHDFDRLWHLLWFSNGSSKQTDRMIKEYHTSKHKFEVLQPKQLPTLVKECKHPYTTPEWEFPKGRRSNRESNLKCAIREFEEETDLTSDEYIVLDNVEPFSEEYTGSNGVRYKHIYYVALYQGTKDLSINTDKFEQYSEIGDIGWFSLEECRGKLRPEQLTKYDILRKITAFKDQWSKDCFLKE